MADNIKNGSGRKTSGQRAYVANARDRAQAAKEGARSMGRPDVGKASSGAGHGTNKSVSGSRSNAAVQGRNGSAGKRNVSGSSGRTASASGRSNSSSSSRTGSNAKGSRSNNSARNTGTSKSYNRDNGEQLTLRIEEDDSLRDEIIIILVLLVSVLLVLSYFHLCGSFGEILNLVIFGLIGSFGYVFPFFAVFVTIFALANKRNRSITGKIIYFICMMFFASGLVQIAAGGFDNSISFTDYFTNSVPGYTGDGRTFGGFFGGAICKLLCPYLGTIGAVCIMVAAVLIFFMLIAGKAIFTSITRSGIESVEERRQRRTEELERRAEEEKIAEEERLAREEEMSEEEEYSSEKGNARRRQISDEECFDESDEAFFEQDSTGYIGSGSVRRKKKKPQGAFIDNLMRRGMGLDIDRIGDTPEYRKMKEHLGDDGYEVDEIEGDDTDASQKHDTEAEAGIDVSAMTGNELVEAELDRKFGSRRTIDVPVLHDHPVVTKTVMTRTIMVDNPDAEDDSEDSVVHFEDYNRSGNGSKSEKGVDTAIASASGESASGKNDFCGNDNDDVQPGDGASDGETPVKNTAKSSQSSNSAQRPRTSSGATSFTTPEQLAALREEQENKPEPPYVFPPIELLTKSKPAQRGRAVENELEETKAMLQKTFESFGVGVSVTNATCGPTVTRYEILPDQGVKVKTITALTDDIKLALAAAEIRIEAPIPGKAAVGIEVPNATTSPVLLRDLLESPEFKDAQSNLTFAVGKDIGGRTICFDIGAMPHLLIAGATGSGKSVCINALILSIIYKAKPSDVRMIMIDPKRVELVGYNGLPHLLVPVVTDVKKATGALNWAMAEMDDRYERFANVGVNNLKSYNRLMEERYYEEGNEGECPDRLPRILIIVDELSDLMMTANPKEVEASIRRLTQLARAAGIHVVLATQRPSVNVITGTIKANIPSRIAFSVSSVVDSRTIIDQAGAEKLLGKGDMLFNPQGYPKPVRLQGAFVSDSEIASVVQFIKDECKEVKYNDAVSKHIERNSVTEDKKTENTSGGAGAGGTDKDGHDELFADAGTFIIKKQKASIGMLQREFKIGFNRAARIMDQLSDEGVVGPEEGTKPRRIIMNQTQFEAYLSEGAASDVSDSESDDDGQDEF